MHVPSLDEPLRSYHAQTQTYIYRDIIEEPQDILSAPPFPDAWEILVDFTRAETTTVQLNTQQQLSPAQSTQEGSPLLEQEPLKENKSEKVFVAWLIL